MLNALNNRSPVKHWRSCPSDLEKKFFPEHPKAERRFSPEHRKRAAGGERILRIPQSTRSNTHDDHE